MNNKWVTRIIPVLILLTLPVPVLASLEQTPSPSGLDSLCPASDDYSCKEGQTDKQGKPCGEDLPVASSQVKGICVGGDKAEETSYLSQNGQWESSPQSTSAAGGGASGSGAPQVSPNQQIVTQPGSGAAPVQTSEGSGNLSPENNSSPAQTSPLNGSGVLQSAYEYLTGYDNTSGSVQGSESGSPNSAEGSQSVLPSWLSGAQASLQPGEFSQEPENSAGDQGSANPVPGEQNPIYGSNSLTQTLSGPMGSLQLTNNDLQGVQNANTSAMQTPSEQAVQELNNAVQSAVQYGENTFGGWEQSILYPTNSSQLGVSNLTPEDTTDVRATIYTPGTGGINGGAYGSQGNYLNPNVPTIAAGYSSGYQYGQVLSVTNPQSGSTMYAVVGDVCPACGSGIDMTPALASGVNLSMQQGVGTMQVGVVADTGSYGAGAQMVASLNSPPNPWPTLSEPVAGPEGSTQPLLSAPVGVGDYVGYASAQDYFNAQAAQNAGELALGGPVPLPTPSPVPAMDANMYAQAEIGTSIANETEPYSPLDWSDLATGYENNVAASAADNATLAQNEALLNAYAQGYPDNPIGSDSWQTMSDMERIDALNAASPGAGDQYASDLQNSALDLRESQAVEQTAAFQQNPPASIDADGFQQFEQQAVDLTGATVPAAEGSIAVSNLPPADLTGATVPEGTIAASTLPPADLTGVTISNSPVETSNLPPADLTDATVSNAPVAATDLGPPANETAQGEIITEQSQPIAEDLNYQQGEILSEQSQPIISDLDYQQGQVIVEQPTPIVTDLNGQSQPIANISSSPLVTNDLTDLGEPAMQEVLPGTNAATFPFENPYSLSEGLVGGTQPGQLAFESPENATNLEAPGQLPSWTNTEVSANGNSIAPWEENLQSLANQYGQPSENLSQPETEASALPEENVQLPESRPSIPSNPSIVDYLDSVGQDASFAARAVLAAANGIENYVGSTAQNLQLLSICFTKGCPKQ